MNDSIALFPGSFNPFTIGHLDIVERALKMFRKIIIVVGVNIEKGEDNSSSVLKIREIFKNNPNVTVMNHAGLTADLVKKMNATCIIRGVRSAADFEYEKTLADTNLEVLGVDTVLIPCRPSLSFISSSMIRELNHFHVNTSKFIP